jgi:SAM-dependent methyltransferase
MPSVCSDSNGEHMPNVSIYEDGTYLKLNPSLHVEESAWKVQQIARMIRRHNLAPQTVCEVGCGAGEVLRLLQKELDLDCAFYGYEISPQAYGLCLPRANNKLSFRLMDIKQEKESVVFDLLLVLDVIEHVEDYFSFLRDVKPHGRNVIIHFPLDLSVQTVLRKNGLMKRRDLYAHLHYFTKDIAIQVLKEVGYEIVDYFYTARSNELGSEFMQRILTIPRTLCFAMNQDFAARTLGGYSLLVLASRVAH